MKDDLEDLIMKSKFLGVYNVEKEQRKIQRTIMEDSLAKGFAEGRASGIEEGRASGKDEARKEAVCNLLKNGASLELVSKSLGFSIEELQKMKDEIK